MIELFKEPNIDWMGKAKYFYALSAILLIAGWTSIFMHGGLRYSIDFKGGTLMEDAHYCGDPAQVRVYPGVTDALRKLRAAGFRTFIVTNQSGIGRGLITEAQYHVVQAELLRQIGDVDPEFIE